MKEYKVYNDKDEHGFFKVLYYKLDNFFMIDLYSELLCEPEENEKVFTIV